MYTVGDIVLYTDEAMRDKCPYGQERGWCCGLGEWIVTEVSKKTIRKTWGRNRTRRGERNSGDASYDMIQRLHVDGIGEFKTCLRETDNAMRISECEYAMLRIEG